MKPLVLTAASLAFAAGCQDWPDPVIRSIAPSEMPASAETRIEISADLPLPTVVNYDTGSIEVDTEIELSIGDRVLETDGIAGSDVLVATVPTVLQPGSYDVRLRLGDGREAVLEQGFTVTDGQWPSGYSIEPIGEQRRLVPFTIIVHAEGPSASTFRGNVRLEVAAGASIGPTLSDAFVEGTLTQQVTLNSNRSEEVIVISDLAGNRVTSFRFTLR